MTTQQKTTRRWQHAALWVGGYALAVAGMTGVALGAVGDYWDTGTNAGGTQNGMSRLVRLLLVNPNVDSFEAGGVSDGTVRNAANALELGYAPVSSSGGAVGNVLKWDAIAGMWVGGVDEGITQEYDNVSRSFAKPGALPACNTTTQCLSTRQSPNSDDAQLYCLNLPAGYKGADGGTGTIGPNQ